MANKRWRTWLVWGLLCFALIGLGCALDAGLPPQPRFVLRSGRAEGIITGALSADGTILTTRAHRYGPDGEISDWEAFKSWDTVRGAERGDFFRGLIAVEGIRGRDDLDATGFDMKHLTYSPDRRYCALAHREGLALADLQTGQEWPRAIEWKSAEYAPESVAVYRMLRRHIDTKTLREKIPLKAALENLSALFGGELKIAIANDLLEAKADSYARPPLQEEVCLPVVPEKMNAEVALRLLLHQVANGDAAYLIRNGGIEITTSLAARKNEVRGPIFSPRSSFVFVLQGKDERYALHLVECASRRLLATLPIDPDPSVEFTLPDSVGFTPDDELLYYWADPDSTPLFTVWDTRRKKVVRTFKEVCSVGSMAPDGETLQTRTHGEEIHLVNLRTGHIRPFPGLLDHPHAFTFSRDGRTLVRQTAEELELWDTLSGEKRGQIKLGPFEPDFVATSPIVSVASRVVCVASSYRRSRFKAWSLDSGERLWPPVEPARENDGMFWDLNMGGLLSRADMSPRFTPDHRFLCERKPSRINLLDPATGESAASVVMDGIAKDPAILAFTPDGRTMLSHWDYVERKPWFGAEWLAKWWPVPISFFIVSDVAPGQEQLRVNIHEPSAHALLSDDGRTLMTCTWHGDVSVVSCWDVPGRPSRWLVIGIPLASACVGVLGRWWMARKRRVPLPAPVVS